MALNARFERARMQALNFSSLPVHAGGVHARAPRTPNKALGTRGRHNALKLRAKGGEQEQEYDLVCVSGRFAAACMCFQANLHKFVISCSFKPLFRFGKICLHVLSTKSAQSHQLLF